MSDLDLLAYSSIGWQMARRIKISYNVKVSDAYY